MNNIRFIFIILALLQLVGCQKAPRTGEAFLVTKSGDIQYMADMLVLGFDQKFLSEYSDWNTKSSCSRSPSQSPQSLRVLRADPPRRTQCKTGS